MSRHTYQGKRATLVLGLDAPLQNFFGQVHGKGAPKMLGKGMGYPANAEGLRSLCTEATKYEEVPPTVVDALEHDLRTFETGGDLSYERVHP